MFELVALQENSSVEQTKEKLFFLRLDLQQTIDISTTNDTPLKKFAYEGTFRHAIISKSCVLNTKSFKQYDYPNGELNGMNYN